jgi:hypothetical protein
MRSPFTLNIGRVASFFYAAELVATQNADLTQIYFGRRLGSPPGLPGGGMTGILPVSGGVGARISGSTPDGGHSTPSDLASLSPSGSWDWPTVESRGAFAPPDPIRSQLVGDCGGGGAVCCGGVAGVGGACAIASADVASNAQTINSERFVCMRTQPRSGASVPKMRANLSGWTAPARLRERSGPFCSGTIPNGLRLGERVHHFVTDAGALTDIDFSAARTFRDLVAQLKKQRMDIVIGRASAKLHSDLEAVRRCHGTGAGKDFPDNARSAGSHQISYWLTLLAYGTRPEELHGYVGDLSVASFWWRVGRIRVT